MSGVARYAVAHLRRITHLAWRHALYTAYGKFRDAVSVQTEQGLLTIPTRDRGIGAPLFRKGRFEYRSSLRALDLLRDQHFLPERGITMLDIGANIGVIGIGLALSGRVNRVLAIEPEPTIWKLLQQNITQNELHERFWCRQIAIGATEATVEMELCADNAGDHRIRKDPAPGARELNFESRRATIESRQCRLDTLLSEKELINAGFNKPSLIWIDVQGYELQAFTGAQQTLGTGPPTMTEICPYMLLRAGSYPSELKKLAGSIWTDYWIERRQHWVRYPIQVFDRFLEELGEDGEFENVLFTREGYRPA